MSSLILLEDKVKFFEERVLPAMKVSVMYIPVIDPNSTTWKNYEALTGMTIEQESIGHWIRKNKSSLSLSYKKSIKLNKKTNLLREFYFMGNYMDIYMREQTLMGNLIELKTRASLILETLKRSNAIPDLGKGIDLT